MADRKISALTALTGANVDQAADFMPINDVSEVDASENKRILIDELRVGMFCGALVRKAADQNTANYSAGAVIAWDQESYDTHAWHDNVTNNSRLTVPASKGITKVIATANINVTNYTPSANALVVEILKNGAVAFDGAAASNPFPAGSATSAFVSVVAGPIACTAGDYFEVKLTCADTSITIFATRSNFAIQAVG